jgi:uncharacterized membrane protein
MKDAQGVLLSLAPALMGTVALKCGGTVIWYVNSAQFLAISNLDQMLEEHAISPTSSSSSTILQLIQFAIVCVLVNVLMHALQSGSFPTLYMLLQHAHIPVIWT